MPILRKIKQLLHLYFIKPFLADLASEGGNHNIQLLLPCDIRRNKNERVSEHRSFDLPTQRPLEDVDLALKLHPKDQRART